MYIVLCIINFGLDSLGLIPDGGKDFSLSHHIHWVLEALSPVSKAVEADHSPPLNEEV